MRLGFIAVVFFFGFFFLHRRSRTQVEENFLSIGVQAEKIQKEFAVNFFLRVGMWSPSPSYLLTASLFIACVIPSVSFWLSLIKDIVLFFF